MKPLRLQMQGFRPVPRQGNGGLREARQLALLPDRRADRGRQDHHPRRDLLRPLRGVVGQGQVVDRSAEPPRGPDRGDRGGAGFLRRREDLPGLPPAAAGDQKEARRGYPGGAGQRNAVGPDRERGNRRRWHPPRRQGAGRRRAHPRDPRFRRGPVPSGHPAPAGAVPGVPLGQQPGPRRHSEGALRRQALRGAGAASQGCGAGAGKTPTGPGGGAQRETRDVRLQAGARAGGAGQGGRGRGGRGASRRASLRSGMARPRRRSPRAAGSTVSSRNWREPSGCVPAWRSGRGRWKPCARNWLWRSRPGPCCRRSPPWMCCAARSRSWSATSASRNSSVPRLLRTTSRPAGGCGSTRPANRVTRGILPRYGGLEDLRPRVERAGGRRTGAGRRR